MVKKTNQNKPSQSATSAPTQEDNKCGTSLPIKSYLTTNHFQESDTLSGSIDAANDDEHEENKKKRSYKKGATLRLDGPIAGLCSLEKGAAYIGLTKSALRVAIHRGQMPGHKTRTNPEDENSDGVWWFNAKEWDKLADELPEHEPQNGTTGKVTGRMTARKGSSLQLIKKTARPLTVSEFIQAEAQN